MIILKIAITLIFVALILLAFFRRKWNTEDAKIGIFIGYWIPTHVYLALFINNSVLTFFLALFFAIILSYLRKLYFQRLTVEAMKARCDVKGLIRAMQREPVGESDRREAAKALGELRSPLAVQPLVAALNDDRDDVGWEARWALPKIGTAAVIPLI